MIVAEDKWQSLERELAEITDEYFSPTRPDGFEVHATELRNGHGPFKRMSVSQRVAFRDAWMEVAANHEIKLIYRGNEALRDVIAWLTQQEAERKKGATRR